MKNDTSPSPTVPIVVLAGKLRELQNGTALLLDLASPGPGRAGSISRTNAVVLSKAFRILAERLAEIARELEAPEEAVMPRFVEACRLYNFGRTPAHMLAYCLIGAATEDAATEIGEMLLERRVAKTAETEQHSPEVRRRAFRVIDGRA